MSGSHAIWKDVLSVYAKANTDPDNAQDVATMAEGERSFCAPSFGI